MTALWSVCVRGVGSVEEATAGRAMHVDRR
eukprot:COSAG03_NODE_12444_length_547_cov_1.267857_1_plen_29_part_01